MGSFMTQEPRGLNFWMVVAAGFAMGLLGVLLAVWGNPENSGICVSCFMENSAGALGLHANPRLQYLRPELIGFILGAALCALAGREFRSRGGSAPLARLAAGVFLIVGCAVFIGCPIKLVLRLTAGDLTVLTGVADDALGMCDETFGPVAYINLFDTEAEVTARANATTYGLAAYVFTRDLDRGFRLMEALEAGMVGVNDGLPTTSNAPFGGVKQSGWGRELGSEGMEAFLDTKHASLVIQ